MPRKLKCSFCGKTAQEVRRLLAGPSVFICDGCVAACNTTLDAHPPQGPVLAGAVRTPTPKHFWRAWFLRSLAAAPVPSK